MHTIQQLTKKFSTTARTLRFYEDKGLIAPTRSEHAPTTRLYSDADVARLTTIFRMRAMRFSIEQIRQYLESEHMLNVLAPTDVRDMLHAQRETLLAQMAQLRAAVGEIEDALAAGDPL